MKEDKFLKENKSFINNTSSRVQGNTIFVSQEPKFVRVKDFGFEQQQEEQVAVAVPEEVEEEAIEVAPIVTEEEPTAEEDNAIMYYAEEIFDDEDDLYSNELHDRLIAKSKYKTYKEMAGLIDEALESRGFSGKFGLDLLAAMNFSHLIRFEKDPGDEFMNAFFDMFEMEHYIYDADSDVKVISNLNAAFNAISTAKNDPEKPVFIYIKNLESKKVIEFLRPVYYFIDNPVGDTYLIGQSRSTRIPENFFILFSLKKDQPVCDISRRLLRYVSTMPVDIMNTKIASDPLGVSLSMTELSRSLNDAMNDYFISEDGWRKFDRLADVIGDINGYTMHNKIIRRNEQYLTVLISADIDENTALDISLSRNIIAEAIITAHPQEYVDDHDLFRALDENFGSGNTPLSEKVVRAYLSLFDKGGNRINE